MVSNAALSSTTKTASPYSEVSVSLRQTCLRTRQGRRRVVLHAIWLRITDNKRAGDLTWIAGFLAFYSTLIRCPD